MLVEQPLAIRPVTDTMRAAVKLMTGGKQQSCGEWEKVNGEWEKLAEYRRFYVQVD